ncbi:hypothetical protein SUDANB126_04101 [Streptomyces sp. enrichment culture]
MRCVTARRERRDLTGGEAVRTVVRLGFIRHEHPEAASAGVPAPLRTAPVPLGGTACPEV